MHEALLEFIPYASVLINETGQIVLCNALVELMFGYAREELQNQPIELLTPAYVYDWYQARINQRNPSLGQARSLALQGRHKDGNEFPLEARCSAYPTNKGDQLLITVVDMSQRRQVAAEISEIHHCLLDHHLAEHQQWAKELHSGPLQDLQGLNFALTALTTEPEVTQKISNELAQMRVTVQQIARQLLDMQNELYPPTLATFGLATAIQSYVKALQKRHPTLAVQLNLAEDGTRLAQPVRMALFYICQQALTNVVQHAAAQKVQIQLTLNDALVQLDIIDDGCGFEVPQHWITIVREKRLGLASVIERAEAIGGFCRIASTPGKGTTLCVAAPILFHTT